MPLSPATSAADLVSAVVAGTGESPTELGVRQVVTETTAAGNDPLRTVHRRLAHAVTTHRGFDTMMSAVVDAVGEIIRPAAVCYAGCDVQPRLLGVRCCQAGLPDDTQQSLPSAVEPSCRKASRHGVADVDRTALPGYVIASVPVFVRGRSPEVLSIVLAGRQPSERDVTLLHLAATNISFWYLVHEGNGNPAAIAGQIEVFRELVQSKSVRQAASILATGICQAVGCDRVAVATVRDGGVAVVLQAWSGVRRVDRRGELARFAEAACREAVLRKEPVIETASPDSQQRAEFACQRLAAAAGVESVLVFPLLDDEGRAEGACILFGTRDRLTSERVLPYLQAVSAWAAPGLGLVARARGSLVGYLWRRVKEAMAMRGKWLIAAAAIGVALLMSLPVAHKIGCDCAIEPVTRRYVAAPYDGVLERALVDAGDVVAADQVLARMDDREIRWELASLYADRAAALKKRDAAMASHDAAAVQFAKLDVQRLDLKIGVLEHRAEHLELKAPVGGMVVVGDLEKAEGAPLSVGQALFEIAPLDAMAVELAVPEEDISYLREGLAVRFRLDAYPGRQWEGRIERIHPRAERREQRQVFVAQLEMENPDRLWKPGMSGHAKIVAARRPLGWVLLHKAWERAAMKFGW